MRLQPNLSDGIRRGRQMHGQAGRAGGHGVNPMRVSTMVTTRRNLWQRHHRGGYGKGTIAPAIREGLPGGAGSFVSSLKASYWDSVVGPFLTPWLRALRAAEPPP